MRLKAASIVFWTGSSEPRFERRWSQVPRRVRVYAAGPQERASRRQLRQRSWAYLTSVAETGAPGAKCGLSAKYARLLFITHSFPLS